MKEAKLITSTILINLLVKEVKENREIFTNLGYTVVDGKVYLLYNVEGELRAQYTRIKNAKPPEDLHGFIPFYPTAVKIIA